MNHVDVEFPAFPWMCARWFQNMSPGDSHSKLQTPAPCHLLLWHGLLRAQLTNVLLVRSGSVDELLDSMKRALRLVPKSECKLDLVALLAVRPAASRASPPWATLHT